MSLIRWSPLQQVDELSRRVGALVHAAGEREPMEVFDWRPAVDVHETAEHFEIAVEVPGVDKADLTVLMDDGVLTIAGERRAPAEREGRKTHRAERTFGRFERSFTLPETVDEERIVAELDGGVLLLKLGKRPPRRKPAGRRIEIG